MVIFERVTGVNNSDITMIIIIFWSDVLFSERVNSFIANNTQHVWNVSMYELTQVSTEESIFCNQIGIIFAFKQIAEQWLIINYTLII